MQDLPCHNSPSYPGLWTLISITLLDHPFVSEVEWNYGPPWCHKGHCQGSVGMFPWASLY